MRGGLDQNGSQIEAGVELARRRSVFGRTPEKVWGIVARCPSKLGLQERPQSLPEPFDLARRALALPHDHNAPPEPAERPLDSLIAGRVPVDLGEPVSTPRRGDAAAAAGVPVPEAAADEDDFVEAGEDEIGSAGERPDVKAVAVAESMSESADDQLRGRVPRFDRRHDAGAFGFGEGVDHGANLVFRIWEQRRLIVSLGQAQGGIGDGQ